MSSQLELTLSKPPRISRADVDAVVAVLRGKGWRSAAEVLEALGRPGLESQSRWLRAVASGSHGVILSYPGSPGYRLTTEATQAEVERARTLLHQADEMRQRWEEIVHVRGETDEHGRPRTGTGEHKQVAPTPVGEHE